MDKLNTAMRDVLKKPEVIAKMKLQGLAVMSNSPAEFAKMISDEIDYWGKVIPSIGLQPE